MASSLGVERGQAVREAPPARHHAHVEVSIPSHAPSRSTKPRQRHPLGRRNLDREPEPACMLVDLGKVGPGDRVGLLAHGVLLASANSCSTMASNFISPICSFNW